jgi:hypothetical protein
VALFTWQTALLGQNGNSIVNYNVFGPAVTPYDVVVVGAESFGASVRINSNQSFSISNRVVTAETIGAGAIFSEFVELKSDRPGEEGCYRDMESGS